MTSSRLAGTIGPCRARWSRQGWFHATRTLTGDPAVRFRLREPNDLVISDFHGIFVAAHISATFFFRVIFSVHF
jgi:hypothetical protein